jgi:hypothetical protein
MTVAPIPTNAPLSIVTWPARRTPGQMCAAVPIIDSWSMMQPVLSIA